MAAVISATFDGGEIISIAIYTQAHNPAAPSLAMIPGHRAVALQPDHRDAP